MRRRSSAAAHQIRSKAAPRLRVGFVLARRFTLCAFANFVDVLRLAADEGDRSRPILCEWAVLSDSGGPIASSCGVTVSPDARMADPSGFDYVVVVGGLIGETPNLSQAAMRYLKRAAAARIPLVGVCTGAFILHRAGLMDGYRCCVSWFHHTDFLEQFDGLTPVSDQIFVVDRDRLTCSGGASAAHLAAHLVEKHVGAAAAHKSLQIMIIDKALGAEASQPGAPQGVDAEDEDVRKALMRMSRNLEEPLAIDDIARRLGVGRRSLERRFLRALGCAPGAAYLAMRLNHAERLLSRPGRSIAAIATATGFCDSSHLTRALRKERGVTPAMLRDRAGGPRLTA